MNEAVMDDYVSVVPTLACLATMSDHRVKVWHDCVTDIDLLAERLRDTEAMVLLRERTTIRKPLIERLTQLKMITLNGPYPHIDVEACTRRGIVVCSEHARTSYATAELTWGLVISAMRHIPAEMARLKSGHWQGSVGTGLRGRTLGIYGYGRIGKQVAGFGRAFGMRVLVWSREKGRQDARNDNYETPDTRDALFENADALEAALRNGCPASAAVDVYEREPVFDAAHPLLARENIICTPHLGYVERDQLANYFSDQFKRVLAFAAGKSYGVVNPEAQAGGPFLHAAD